MFAYRASDGELASEEEIVMIDILPAEVVPDENNDGTEERLEN